jgi:CHAT domain-containing protein
MDDAQPTSSIDALTERAQQLWDDNHPADAAEIYKAVIQRLDSERSEEVLRRGEMRRILGNALRDSRDLAGSTAALEDAVGVLQPAPDSPNRNLVLAFALGSVAMNYDAVGQPGKADAARQQSLDLADRLLTTDAEQAVRIYLASVGDLRHLGHADWQRPLDLLMQKVTALDTEPALRALQPINRYAREKRNSGLAQSVVAEGLRRVRGLDDAGVAANFAAIHNIAYAAVYCDSLDAAREMTHRLSVVADQTKPDELYNARRLKALIASRSDDQEAVDLTRKVYEFARDTFGEDDTRTRISQRELAEALEGADKTDEAVTVYSALFDREKRIGKDPLTAAEIASALARLLDNDSRFTEAIDVRWTEFQLRRDALGDRDPRTNTSRYEVAELCRVLGRVEEGEFLYRQVLDLDDGSEPEFAARVRNNLGEVYSMVGKYALAKSSFDEALAIRSKASHEDSERVWRSRRSLALLANRTGDADTAISFARKAIAREDFTHDVGWRLILATGLLIKGQHAEAEETFRRIYNSMPRDLIGTGVSFDAYFAIVSGLTTCLVAREDWQSAVELLAGIVPVVREHLTSLVQQFSELQLVEFARHLLDVQSLWLLALSRTTSTPDQLAAAFDLVQLTKGLRTRYLRWRQPGSNLDTIMPSDEGASLRKLLADIRETQDDLATALLTPTESTGGAEPMPLLLKRAQLRRLERQLASGIGASEVAVEQALSSSPNLLPNSTGALELLVVFDVLAQQVSDSTPAHRYMAFVVTAGATRPTLRLVDLGLCDEIDTAITGMRDSLITDAWTDEARPPAWQRLSRFLGAKILTPVWNEISPVAHLLIAPDGLLGALPFEILSAPDGGYLLDKMKVSYVMRFGELARDREVFSKGSAPIVMAGPDFNLLNAFVSRRSGGYGAERLFARALGGATRFEDLNEARVEGEEVAALLGVAPMNGVWALGPELARARSPEIIHLSTHGFSLPYEHAEVSASLSAPLGNAIDRRTVLEDPMQRSGLAMAGANAVLNGRAIPPEAGAGVLYAADIQQLDLQRTDLVLLSACRSGLGDVSVGDGAHGLRRAFLAAGARSVVSTLWDVPELSSKRLVTHFYERLLKEAMRVEALADARAAVRQDHPRDPVHWAGFVLDGSFGPLARFTALGGLSIATLSVADFNRDVRSDDAMSQRAQRIIRDPNPQPEMLKSALVLKGAAARRDLREDDRTFVLFKLADLSNRLGDNIGAIERFHEALGMKSLSAENRVNAAYNIAKILNQMGEVRESVDAYTEMLTQTMNPDMRARVLINRGYGYLVLEEMDQATADFTAVIDDKGSPADQRFLAHMNRSGALADRDPEQALRDLEAVIASGQADEVEMLKARIFHADLLIGNGKPQQALDEIQKLEQIPDLSDETRERLSELRERATA